jgi:microcystin-dependent protein
MSEPFIGEIMIVGFNYAPRYWAFCNGQTMPISQNQALFSLLGTTFGGNGIQTFQLPDLQAKIALHRSTQAGTYTLGAVGGVPSVTLQPSQIPAHTHPVNATDTTGSTDSCMNAYLAGMTNAYAPANVAPSTLTTIHPNTVSSAGGSASHDNRQPFTGMTFIIALQGIFPSRN